MDPLAILAAALTLANGGLALATRVWDATPKEQQIASASDWAKFTHNIGTFVLNVQDKIEHIGK